ncbi:MAG: SLC13 family permease [Rhodospirillaceae bacterium]
MTDPRAKPGFAQLTALAVLAVSIALLVLPAPDGIDPRVMRGAALTLFAMGFFAAGAMPEFITGLAFFAAATLIKVAPADVIFAGWTTKALWLTVGGLILGLAVNRTGLGFRLAARLTRLYGPTYAGQTAAMVTVGVALAFVMPSTLGRIILLMPIAMALADRLGLGPGRPGRYGLAAAMVWGTWMPSASILPSNVPNMVLAGVAENLWNVHITYGEYLALHFPMVGILKALLIYAAVRTVFRDRVADGAVKAMEQPGPMSRDEKILVFILAATLTFWALDFLHGISSAWIALAAAVACLLPGIAIVPAADFQTKFNTASAIYVAAVLSVAAVIVDTGFGQYLGGAMASHLPLEPGETFRNYYALVGLGAATGMLTTAPGVAAILAPFAQDLATAAGLPIKSVLLLVVVGYSSVILPYQGPPLVVGIQLAEIPFVQAVRMTLLIAAVTFAVLVPVNYLWWRFLGYL